MSHCVVILAAGAASRFGSPKQLARNPSGATLVEAAVGVAREAGATPLVVLGAHREAIAATLPGVARVVAEDWALGMGASVRAAAAHPLAVAAETVTLLACDQPHVTSRDLRSLRRAALAQGCAAAAYDGILGIPACFAGLHRQRLAGLAPERGARGLLRGGALHVVGVPMPAAAIDIDTQDDLRRFVARPGEWSEETLV